MDDNIITKKEDLSSFKKENLQQHKNTFVSKEMGFSMCEGIGMRAESTVINA